MFPFLSIRTGPTFSINAPSMEEHPGPTIQEVISYCVSHIQDEKEECQTYLRSEKSTNAPSLQCEGFEIIRRINENLLYHLKVDVLRIERDEKLLQDQEDSVHKN